MRHLLRLRIFLPLVVIASLGCDASPRVPGHPAGGFHKGIVFGLFSRDDAGHRERALDEIRALGADSVMIMIPWVIETVRSTDMAPRGDMTPSDRALRQTIRGAHQRGMRIFLMPFLYVNRMAEGEWRGTIDPPSWADWFAKYESFILHYARLAEQEQAHYLSVGSELCSTESRRREWARLIRRVRAEFGGKITYSANWDHRDAISFAEQLDVLGMNAYFELTDSAQATEEDLVAAWEPIIEDIRAWRRELGKKLILTEVGYPSRAGAAIDPWNHAVGGEPAPDEQYRCYRAFREVWGGDPGLEGVYFYIWWGEGGLSDTGYTPRGKPAEAVIRDWFKP